MNLNTILIFISSLSFLVYVASYFVQPNMKNEFKRFKLEKLGLLVIILELLGALGLLVGLSFNFILILSSLGLTLLMFCGLLVRIKMKDSIWISIPVIFYMLLNLYIFTESIK